MFLLFFCAFFSALYLYQSFNYCLLFFLFSVLFSTSFFIQLIFWFPLLSSFQICSPFFSPFLLFYCLGFSLMFYYYSIWLLSVIHHLFRALCPILFCYIFYSCFCFLYTPSFWFGFNYTFCSVPFCLSLFSVYSLAFLFYASFLLLFLFLLFFCSLLFSLLFATPFLNVNFFSTFWSFRFYIYFYFYLLFLIQYHYYPYYFLSSLFCLYSFITSAHWLGVLYFILCTLSAVWHSSTCSVVSSFPLHLGYNVLFLSSVVLFQFPVPKSLIFKMFFTPSLSQVAVSSFLSHLPYLTVLSLILFSISFSFSTFSWTLFWTFSFILRLTIFLFFLRFRKTQC